MNCQSVSDVLGPHTYLSSPVFLAGNDSRMMKVSDVAHCRRIDFGFAPHISKNWLSENKRRPDTTVGISL